MSSNKILKPIKQALRFIPDRQYIQLYYLAKFHKLCNLRHPTTYNEKLQWLKLNYRIPEHARLVDKYAVKEVVAGMIGVEHVIPTLAVYDSAEDINFDGLPNSFVLKCTHDSEGVVLVKDKSSVDTEDIRSRLRAALKQNFYFIGREPHYRDIPPRVIAEPFMEDHTHGQLRDYKFFCFNGAVKALYIASDRASQNVKSDYFDAAFNPLDLRHSYARSVVPPSKPARYEKMLEIAQELSRDHPHVRVDLYEVDGRIYFGELTFFHSSGFAPFRPSDWDEVWGRWLQLPEPVDRAKVAS